MRKPKDCFGLRLCFDACRVWFLLAWKERLLDIVVKIEKRRKVGPLSLAEGWPHRQDRAALCCDDKRSSVRQQHEPIKKPSQELTEATVP